MKLDDFDRLTNKDKKNEEVKQSLMRINLMKQEILESAELFDRTKQRLGSKLKSKAPELDDEEKSQVLHSCNQSIPEEKRHGKLLENPLRQPQNDKN